MTRHTRIQRHLYDDITGDLPSDLHAEIEEHLRTCSTCRTARASMLQTLSLIHPPEILPSEERSDEFWQTFASRVEQRLVAKPERATGAGMRVVGDFTSLLGMRWRSAAAIAAAFAVLAGVVLLVQNRAPETEPTRAAHATAPASTVTQVDQKAARYFRRSQAVLVGLTNKKPESGNRIDLEAEREASHALAFEARILKHQMPDVQSARLVGDLERIFIGVANSSPREGNREIELIRGGIRQENLLFKVRMAQARYEPDRYH